MARSAKKSLMLLAQLAVSVALMVYVCGKIQLDDHLTLEGPDGQPGVVLVGQLLSDDPGGPVRIRLASGEVREVPLAQVHHSHGHVVGVVPGFKTIVRRVDGAQVALGFAALVAGYLVSVVRWWMLLRWQGLPVGFGQVFRWTYIGIFFNNVMLGSTGGDVIKALYVARECRDRTRAVVSVFVDRAIGMLSLAVLAGIVTTPYAARPEFREAALFTYALLAGALGGSAVYFSRRIRRVLRVDAILARLPFQGILREIDNAVLIYRNHLDAVGLGVLLSLLGHSLLVCATLFLGAAIGIDQPASTYFIFVPVVLILTAIPIAIQGWGVQETIFQVAFAKVGVADESAVALSLANRIAVMVFSLGGGLCMLRAGQVPVEEPLPEVPGGAAPAAATD